MRPRVTPNEVSFIAGSLKTYISVLTYDAERRQHLEWKIQDLKRKIWTEGPHAHYKELAQAKEELKNCLNPQDNINRRLVAKRLVKRFEALNNGGRLHSSIFTNIILEPKTPQNSNSSI